jgi:hypothetical protein
MRLSDERFQRAKDALNELCDAAEENGLSSTDVDALKSVVRTAFCQDDNETELTRLREENAWKPIETAPIKESILVYVPADEDLGYVARITAGKQYANGRWEGCSSLEDGVLPTHWKSVDLPAAPLSSNEVEG